MIYSDVARRLARYSLLLVIVAAFPLHMQSGTGPAAPVLRLAAADTDGAKAGGMRAAAELDAKDAYRLALLKLKGHLGIARTLLQLRAEGADYHLGKPMRDIFQAAQAEFERRSAPFTADTLAELEHAAAGDPVTALATLESAATAINGSFVQTGALNAASVLAVSEALLREAVADYAAAVVDNEVVDLHKYQSGRGFANEAEALVRHASTINRRRGHAELLLAVTLIRQAWPGVMPPPIVSDPPSVAGRLEEAVAAMDELR